MDKPICVVGRGVVGSCFADDSRYELVSHKHWPEIRENDRFNRSKYSGYICAAGIVGTDKCRDASMDEIYRANVGLPREILSIARIKNVPFIAFSSTCIYHDTTKRCEELDDTHSWTRYAASKTAMEHALLNSGSIYNDRPYKRLFILRIPLVVLYDGPRSFRHKVAAWKVCEDVVAPIIHRAEILKAVKRCFEIDTCYNIYNLYSQEVHLPSFISEHCGWDGIIMTMDDNVRTPNPTLNITRAERDGLL